MAKKIPLRQCVGCRIMKSKSEMMRIMKNGSGEIMFDAAGRQNGRGAYICHNIDCFRAARKNKGLERSLKIVIPSEIYESLEIELK
jgi:predicted RNA-binding protein YlxR (DUF448 family)